MGKGLLLLLLLPPRLNDAYDFVSVSAQEQHEDLLVPSTSVEAMYLSTT